MTLGTAVYHPKRNSSLFSSLDNHRSPRASAYGAMETLVPHAATILMMRSELEVGRQTLKEGNRTR